MTMTVQEAINKRYSTRYLDPNKKIEDGDMEVIISAGQKAPSGLATEPWQFVVVNGETAKLSEAMYHQPVVANASHIIAVLTYKSEYTLAHPEIFTEKYKASGFPQEQVDRTLDRIENHLPNPTQYFREQGFIAATQMVLQATELGIGSVMIGGYDENAVAKLLNIDTNKFQIAIMVVFGYSTDTETKKRVIRPYETTVKKVTF